MPWADDSNPCAEEKSLPVCDSQGMQHISGKKKKKQCLICPEMTLLVSDRVAHEFKEPHSSLFTIPCTVKRPLRSSVHWHGL